VIGEIIIGVVVAYLILVWLFMPRKGLDY